MDLTDLLQPPPRRAASWEDLVPPAGVVQLGWVDLTQPPSPLLAQRLADFLSSPERERLQRFRFPEDRAAFLVGRSLIRGLLARLLGLAPEEVPLGIGPHGRPELLPNAHATPPSFNVSHTQGVVGFALSRSRVGLDVERFRRDPDPLAIGGQVFSADELAALRALEPTAQRERFRRLWTLKEAYLKARGTGLTLPAREITCTLEGGGARSVSLRFTDAVADVPTRWQCVELRPTAHTWAAVCVEAAPGAPVRVDEAWLTLPAA